MPEAGDVIPYWYLWWRERAAGEESGRKMRPCVVLVVIVKTEGEKSRIAVLPITHSPPVENDAAVEVPTYAKHVLGLDDQPSWIVCDEFNDFAWPGHDIGATSAGLPSFGKLFGKVFARVRKLALERIKSGKARVVTRN